MKIIGPTQKCAMIFQKIKSHSTKDDAESDVSGRLLYFNKVIPIFIFSLDNLFIADSWIIVELRPNCWTVLHTVQQLGRFYIAKRDSEKAL